MTPDELCSAIRDAIARAVDSGEFAVEIPGEIVIERPKNRAHGDYATNIALRLAKPAGKSPRQVAEAIAKALTESAGIAAVDVAGPGFLNITIEAGSLGQLARSIVEAGATYGNGDALTGRRINLEFVSANPTGPVHIGGVRWAAVGDSLARILTAAGAEVAREYYFNDHGAQIDRFATSLLAAALGEPTPENGYAGAYIGELASRIIAEQPGLPALPRDEAQEALRARGVDLMFAEIKASMHEFGVDFDVYTHENSLHESGAVNRAIARLREQGRIFEADGAVWLRTTDFGDDKDRVVIKADGEPAYIAGDLAYYLDKRDRGFDRVVIMLGADHHGYVGRLMAMCACFGDTPGDNLQVLIGQMVNLVKDGQPVRMGKRAGNVVTQEDLVDAVGVDAARYQLARSSTDSSIDIDLDLLTRATNENPVHYVQYAHARTANVLKNAAAVGITLDVFEPELLDHETETTLLTALGDFPRVVAQAALLHEPHRVARYLEELAGHFHRWYDSCRVIPKGDEEITDINRTRLWLDVATKTVLANGLALLGVSAPDRK
ncbi:MAG: arginine--tRNA ligase [Actinomycetota bacterium]|nr:arginine--tRNA ligase [Actinomycetota bacterium]